MSSPLLLFIFVVELAIHLVNTIGAATINTLVPCGPCLFTKPKEKLIVFPALDTAQLLTGRDVEDGDTASKHTTGIPQGAEGAPRNQQSR
jgi:hypothetical protein